MMQTWKNMHDRQFMEAGGCRDASHGSLDTNSANAVRVKKHRRVGFLLCVMATLLSGATLLAAGIAGAADTTLTPRLTVSGSYDDNILLSAADKVSSPIVTVSPSILLNYETLRSNLSLLADLDILRYLDESDLDRTNQYYRFSADHRPTERWVTSINANFYKDTTLNTYLQETGRVIDRVERDYLEGRVGMAYNLSLVSTIGGAYRYQTADYSRNVYSDYDNHNANLYYAHRLKNERDTISIGPGFYHRTNDNNDVDSYSLDLGWARDWTSITRSVASIGVRHTSVTQKRGGTDSDNVGAKASLEITSRGLASTTTFHYFHDLRTTADGNDVNVDNLLLDYRRSITERFGVGLNARLVFSYKLFSEQSNLNDTRYYWLEPYLSYRITRDLSASLRYRYQNHVEHRPQDDLTRERNIVWLQLSYGFPINL